MHMPTCVNSVWLGNLRLVFWTGWERLWPSKMAMGNTIVDGLKCNWDEIRRDGLRIQNGLGSVTNLKHEL